MPQTKISVSKAERVQENWLKVKKNVQGWGRILITIQAVKMLLKGSLPYAFSTYVSNK